MIRPIFIHNQPSFLDRIQRESNGEALTSTSMVEALKWITNPVQHISGLYLNPDSTTFSALKFIEITLSHRPSLPIFLLEGKLGQNKEHAERVTSHTHIRGVFSGSEPYSTLVSPLKEHIKVDVTRPRAIAPKLLHPGYVTLPVSDFFVGSRYPFDIFVSNADEDDVRLFAPKDGEIDPNYLNLLAQKNPWVLVREQDVAQCSSRLKNLRDTVAHNVDIPATWRSAEVLVNAKNLLEEMKKSGVTDTLVEYTHTMLADLLVLISSLEEDEDGALSDVIERAKSCGRSIFCASYSMLICKQMKFEKTATLEILGFASILQDVSLYQTPFGDLSEKPLASMNSEELNYYYKHPVLSSDLVAHHTDVPQVTLQVIRQHHEMKNRTGFPNKIGGSQLHIMAEILSMINHYYDFSLGKHSAADLIQFLNKKVFPNYSDHLVTAFKQVFGNLLRENISHASL